MTTANKTIKINDVEAAKKLVCAAVRCPFDIDIVSKGKIFIDAKSILGVLSLDVEEPLELKYDGYDEDFESVIAGLEFAGADDIYKSSIYLCDYH